MAGLGPGRMKGERARTRRRTTILLVEDERMIRNMMEEVLEHAGYDVVAYSDPHAAIEACRSHCGVIDLLLTDVVMPGMNGRAMAEEIRKVLPTIRVVFMSGYTENALIQTDQTLPRIDYLQKPFKLEALKKKLAQVLGRSELQLASVYPQTKMAQ